jgi:hypothetical protein
VERVIGSIRRECLDHVMVVNARVPVEHRRRSNAYRFAARRLLKPLSIDAPAPQIDFSVGTTVSYRPFVVHADTTFSNTLAKVTHA